jgi:Amt family ammonium transporter
LLAGLVFPLFGHWAWGGGWLAQLGMNYGLGHIPGHNAIVVLFGCMVVFVGWLGLTSAGAMLFAGVEVGRAPLMAVNTLLSASASALATAVITRIDSGSPMLRSPQMAGQGVWWRVAGRARSSPRRLRCWWAWSPARW